MGIVSKMNEHTNGVSSSADCIFCKIVKKEIPAKILLENEYAMAFLDVNPIANGHCIVIPKKHINNLMVCDNDEILYETMKMVRQVAKILDASKLQPWGINYLSNQGPMAGQVIYHWHFHVIPKYAKNEGMILTSKPSDLEDLDDVLDILKTANGKQNKLEEKNNK